MTPARVRLPLYGCEVIVPPGTPDPDAHCEALDLQTLLCADAGEARWHSRWETYTCTLGVVEGGTQ